MKGYSVWDTFFRKASSTSSGSQEKSSHETAQVAFKLYDRDKDGYITKAEMVKISKTLTKEQVEKVGNNNVIIPPSSPLPFGLRTPRQLV